MRPGRSSRRDQKEVNREGRRLRQRKKRKSRADIRVVIPQPIGENRQWDGIISNRSLEKFL